MAGCNCATRRVVAQQRDLVARLAAEGTVDMLALHFYMRDGHWPLPAPPAPR